MERSKAGVLEQHVDQDPITHDAERYSEGQDGGSLSLELVELGVSVFEPNTTFKDGITHLATHVRSIGGIQTSQPC